MARLNVEELVGGLLEAAMVSQGISERQHINALRNYFNEDGTPKTTSFNVGGKDLVVPLYILADHSSIGLDELEIEFSCRLIFGNDDKKVSGLKKSILGLFRKKSTSIVFFKDSAFRRKLIFSFQLGLCRFKICNVKFWAKKREPYVHPKVH